LSAPSTCLGARDFRHAQVELCKIFNADGVAHGLVLCLVLLLLGVALRRIRLRHCRRIEQFIKLLFLDARDEVLERPDPLGTRLAILQRELVAESEQLSRHARCSHRQDGRQIDRQQEERVNGVGADAMQVCALGGVLGEFPRFIGWS
jgi:hypothetical protein